MKNPFRFWMTGGAAMILAALSGGARGIGAAEERPVQTRVSRFGVEETVSRIEASALRHGLPVLARLQQPRHTRAERDYAEPRLVIVLESSQGGTPVSMDDANGPAALLLSVVVRRGQGGATEVWLPMSSVDEFPESMTAAVRHDVADLPSLVDEALADEAIAA